MKTKKNLPESKIFITGGSAGLGRALALQLSARGALVTVLGRDRERLQELQAADSRIQIVQGDISRKDDIHRIHAEMISKMGDADILINNASSLGPVPLRWLIDTDCEDFAQALETNLIGPFRLTKLMLPSMLLKKSGLIINISSDAALQDYPAWGAYSVSKSALDHLTRIFQAELADSGVHFAAIDPGDMNTHLHRTALPEADLTALHAPQDSARLLIEYIENNEFSAQHRSLR